MGDKLDIYPCFEPATATWQYVVADAGTRDAVIIDPVLDFDPDCNRISTESADRLLLLVAAHNLRVGRILETHAHADHLTAATYLQRQLESQGHPRPDICIGVRITEVQANFAKQFGIETSELQNVFDTLFQDNAKFTVGGFQATVLHLPGHTSDHVGYVIGENIFAGDSIFNPDVGSARADFPGGSAIDLYSSSRVLLGFPEHYRLYIGHDYPPESRATNEEGEKARAYTTVKQQREENRHVKIGTTKEEFVKLRSERDASLGSPRRLHQSLQFNIRAGRLPRATSRGLMMADIHITASNEFLSIMS